jgi:hypothetical protein
MLLAILVVRAKQNYWTNKLANSVSTKMALLEKFALVLTG